MNVRRSASKGAERLTILRRSLPRGTATALFYRCSWCQKPRPGTEDGDEVEIVEEPLPEILDPDRKGQEDE